MLLTSNVFCAAAAAKDCTKQESKVTQFNSEVINWDKNKPLQLGLTCFYRGSIMGFLGMHSHSLNLNRKGQPVSHVHISGDVWPPYSLSNTSFYTIIFTDLKICISAFESIFCWIHPFQRQCSDAKRPTVSFSVASAIVTISCWLLYSGTSTLRPLPFYSGTTQHFKFLSVGKISTLWTDLKQVKRAVVIYFLCDFLFCSIYRTLI